MINTNLIQILSDLFVNLAAGWLGAAVIIPIYEKNEKRFSWIPLIINFVFGTLSLGVAYFLIWVK